MSSKDDDKKFPVSKTKTIKGSRHLAREKVMQVLAASSEGEISLDDVFPHVFYRRFTFDSEKTVEGSRILRPDEVFEMEADIAIEWSPEDVDYAVRVIETARNNRTRSNDLIEKHSRNWEMERIALLDKVIIRLAIAELMSCSEIPVKVTINEVIELAKRYSTDKSGVFINGILDAITAELREANLILKTGRGLVE
jgi:transcription antitermination factor NusB